MTRHTLRYWYYLLMFPVVLALAGCGAMPSNTTTGSGIGADAGPWPTAPTRSTANNNHPASDQVPNAPLTVVLRAATAGKDEMRLDIAGVDLKCGGDWYEVANKAAITAISPLPLRANEKADVFLLAKAMVPKRKYSYLRLRLDDNKTMLANDAGALALTLKSNIIELKDWQPDEKKKMNVLAITLDGTKATRATDSATLPADAIAVQPENATGAISGKLIPPLPTAMVNVLWGNSKVSFGQAAPAAKDGSFSITDLPSGAYTLSFTTPGYRLVEPPKDAVTVADKTVTLKDLALTPDTAAAH